MPSLDERMIRELLSETLPSFQASHEGSLNLGFGFLYYGLARVLRPRTTVVLGSKKGFSVLCLALAMKDNGGSGIARVSCYATELARADPPRLHFVDPSYDWKRDGPAAMWGIGFWDDPDEVRSWWRRFGVEDVVEHHRMRSDEFARAPACPESIDLLLIDADHTPGGILGDLESFERRVAPGGLILAHDVHPDCTLGGGEAYEAVDPGRFEKLRLAVYPGLVLFQRKGEEPPRPEIDPT